MDLITLAVAKKYTEETVKGGGGNIKGVILALCSSFGFASYILIDEKGHLAEYDPMVVLFYVSGVFFILHPLSLNPCIRFLPSSSLFCQVDATGSLSFSPSGVDM